MDYAEAFKKVQGMKAKENFLVFEISYNNKLVLPYNEGVTLLGTLAKAEQLNEEYNSQHSISPFVRESIKVTVMSHVDYENYKMAQLLGLTPKEVAQMRAAADSMKKDEEKP